MPTYQISFDAELDNGITHRIQATSPSSKWKHLRPNRFTVDLPAPHFAHSKRVPDEARYAWQNGKLIRVPADSNPQNDAIVVLIESPHAHEYTEQFDPIGPLKNPTSEARLFRFLPDLLRHVEARPMEQRRSVVLCNPIQWQTSLFHLLPSRQQKRLQSAIRNTVWKALWKHQGTDSRFVFQDDFIHRIKLHSPYLILNACTGGKKGRSLKQLVQASLTKNFCGPRDPLVKMVSAHPSAWSSATKILPDGLTCEPEPRARPES